MKTGALLNKYLDMSLSELQKKLQEEKYALIKTKMEFSFGKNKIHTNISQIKKEIAKINTVITDKLINAVNVLKDNDDKQN